MDLRLREHLAKLFNGQKKSKKDVRENHRAMAKLLKEAQRLKTVLSANVDFMAQVSPCAIVSQSHLAVVLHVRTTGHLRHFSSPFKCPPPPSPQVEGLMDDIDFKAKVTRAEFEDLCADLFERVPQPVKDALTAAEMTMVSPVNSQLCLSHLGFIRVCVYYCIFLMDLSRCVFCLQSEIEQVILVGGATRVPKVQEVLLKAVGK